VGGKIPLTAAEREETTYFSPLILPPRLIGKNEAEVCRLAEENRARIEPFLVQIKKWKPAFLLVNDVTLYLQAGTADHLLSCIEEIPTVLLNGYYGRYFGESPFSQRERSETEALMSQCDRVIFLPPFSLAYRTPILYPFPPFQPAPSDANMEEEIGF
jgi:hypothetical protein